MINMKNIILVILLFSGLTASAQFDPDTIATQKENKYWLLKNGAILKFLGTGGIQLPTGTTAERPTVGASDYVIRGNTDSAGIDFWNGFQWMVIPLGSYNSRANRNYVTWDAITDQAEVYNDDKGIKRINGSGTIENYTNETVAKGRAIAWKITARDDNNMRVGLNPTQSGAIGTVDYVAILNFYISAERDGVSEGYSTNPTAATNGSYWRIAFNTDNSVTLDNSSDGSSWTQMHTYSGTDPADEDLFYVVFYGAAINFGTDEIFIMNIL